MEFVIRVRSSWFSLSRRVQARYPWGRKKKQTAGMQTVAYNVLLRVLVRGNEVDGLHVTEVNVVPEHEDIEQLADVLLAVVSWRRRSAK